MGKKRNALGQLFMGGLSFVNGMNSAWSRAKGSERDKFPEWFKDMKGHKPEAPAAAKVEAPATSTQSTPSDVVFVDPPEASDTAATSGDVPAPEQSSVDAPDTAAGGDTTADAGYADAWDALPEAATPAPVAPEVAMPEVATPAVTSVV